MLKLNRDLEWREFGELTGICPRTISYIKNGHKAGGRNVLEKLVKSMASYGIILNLSDFEKEP